MTDRKKTCILIASSQPSIRSSLKLLLIEEGESYVVAVAGDSHELLKKIGSTTPDIVLLDWELLDRSTPVLINVISALEHKSTIIVLSPDADHRAEALHAGAHAFVDISTPPAELITTVENLVSAKNL